MRSLFRETLICASALALSAGCSKDPAVAQRRDLPMVAFLEETSWFDHGVKAIVFPHGVLFVMRMDFDPASRSDRVKMHKVALSRADQQLLLNVMEQHHFFDLPRCMHSRVCDGSSVRVLCADAHREHWVYSYESQNRDFLAFQKVFMDTVSKSVAAAESLSAAEFVENVAAEIETLPKGSTLRNTAATWLDCIVRSRCPVFWGVGDTTRFTLPGDRPKVFRDLPGAVDEPLWNEPPSEQRNAPETPVAEVAPLLDPAPGVVESLLPDPDPIVVEFPVLDR